MSYFSTLQSIAGANLLAHWKLDDNNGAVVEDSANNYNLTLVGTNGTNYKRQQPSMVRSDPTGRSMWFDGSFGHAYRNPTGALTATQTSYTLNAWCQPLEVGDGLSSILGINNKYRLRHVDDGTYGFQVTGTNSVDHSATVGLDYAFNFSNRSSAQGVFNSRVFHMVTLVVQTSDGGGTVDLYLDGLRATSRTYTTYTDNNPTAAIGLANVGNGAGEYFFGWLQHVSVITTALTDTQVRLLYQAGVATPASSGDSTIGAATVFPWETEIIPADSSRKRITICNDSRLTMKLAFSVGGTNTLGQLLGEWSATQAYVVTNKVIYNNVWYVAKVASTNIVPTNTDYWQVLPATIDLRYGERWTSDTYNGSIYAVINPPLGYGDVTVMSE